jgi:lysozyme
VWTQEQADEALEHDAQAAGLAVMRLVDIQMTQGEFDALTDFVFNEGAGRLASSTLLKLMNGGDIVGAGNQLLRWDWAGGKVVAGLAERRQAELQLWNS